MDRARWTIVPIALISLLNLPAAFASTGDTGPDGSGWAGTALGVVGVVAIVAIVRRSSWGRSLAIAVGALNVAGGVWAVAAGFGNGVVGVVLGAVITVLAVTAPADRPAMREAHS
jgi:hypothetical protein